MAGSPIFIIGPGRSGTTLLQSLLCLHEDVAWPSTVTGRITALPQLAILSRLNDVDSLRRRMQGKKLWVRPTERYTIWDRFIPGFSQSDLESITVSDASRKALRIWFDLHVRWQGKLEMVVKYTGFPRIGVVRQVFPDAAFVDIQRNPVEVVLSLREKNWRLDDTSPEAFATLSEREKLDYYAQRFLAYWHAYAPYDGKFLRVRYEDLVTDLPGVMKTVAAYVGLPMTGAFRSRLGEIPIRRSWRQSSGEEAEYLRSVLSEPTATLAYR